MIYIVLFNCFLNTFNGIVMIHRQNCPGFSVCASLTGLCCYEPSIFCQYFVHCLSSIYLFGVLCRFQHCTGHIMMGSWKSRKNQYIQFVRVLYCKLPTNGRQLPAFPHEAVPGIKPGLRGGIVYLQIIIWLMFNVWGLFDQIKLVKKIGMATRLWCKF